MHWCHIIFVPNPRYGCRPNGSKVEFVLEKPGGEKFDVGGVLYDKVRLTMVLDGYTAPVTAGTIVDLVQRGALFLGDDAPRPALPPPPFFRMICSFPR